MLKYVDYTDRVCSDCFEEKNKMLLNQQGKQIFLRIILPSAVGGVIIGFLLGWLFFKRLLKKRTKKKSLHSVRSLLCE